MRPWSRSAYVAATAALAGSGAAAAVALELGRPAAVLVGVGTAWALQAPSFWRLAAALEEGGPVTRTWVAGMAVRLGGLAVLAVAGSRPELPRADLLLAYVSAVLVLLGLEAVWLRARGPAQERDGGT